MTRTRAGSGLPTWAWIPALLGVALVLLPLQALVLEERGQCHTKAAVWLQQLDGFQDVVLVLLAGLLAMNWFEPMAGWFQSQMGTGNWAYRWDVIMLLGLFTAFVFGLRSALVEFEPAPATTV